MSELGSSTRYCSRCLSTFEEDHEKCPNLSCRRPRPQAGWGRMYGPGDVFDRHYRIHNLLALGGAGVTYLAREVGVDGEEIGPRLALKVLFASRDEGPYLRRLATEAQILQELDHPNIVQYLGFVHRAGHSPYLVTRFEPGGSLLDHIKRVGSMPVKRACQVGRQICWALDKAHSMGIVHRDLKPENVLLARVVGPDEDPVVRVADFGIAKVQGSFGGMTRVGAFVGTPQYAAPEQFIGIGPTAATDVYAVGALLYFCTMVMSVLRSAERLDPEEGYRRLVDALPPVVERSNDEVDMVRRVNQVLEICMAPDPEARCTIGELDEMLGAVAAGREPALLGRRHTAPEPTPTLAAEPDSQEVLAPVPVLAPPSSPASAPSAATAPTVPRPPPTRSVSPGPLPSIESPEPTVPLPARAPTASGTAEAAPKPAPKPAPSPPPRKKRGCLAPLMGFLLLCAGGVVAGTAWLYWVAPQDFPDAIRPTPRVIDPADPDNAALITRLQGGLAERLVSVREHCEPDKGRFTAVMVVEPGGQIRSLEMKELDPGLDGQCIGERLIEAPLPSPGARPVKLAIALDLAGTAPRR